jgi:hypothetical protein
MKLKWPEPALGITPQKLDKHGARMLIDAQQVAQFIRARTFMCAQRWQNPISISVIDFAQ